MNKTDIFAYYCIKQNLHDGIYIVLNHTLAQFLASQAPAAETYIFSDE